MCKTVIIQRDTPIIIFGAGFTGYHYYELLKENGMAVSCFIDWKADKLNPRNETRIFRPDDGSIVKDEAVVIIGLSNIFEHREIVEQLNGLGYSFFIYYDLTNEERKSVYECFTKGEPLIHKKIAQYQAGDIDWEKSIMISENEVTVQVPFEIVYTASKLQFMYLDEEREYFKSRKGKSIFSVIALINLYEILEKGIPIGAETDVLEEMKTYKRNMEAGSYREDIFEIQFNQWLCSRYTVWQRMTRELQRGLSFFYESAPSISRNEKGIFEERDGNNRAAFFMAKRIYRMPYRMSRVDYETWVNRKVLKKVSDYISKNCILKLPYPIPHPYFYFFDTIREIYAPKRLFNIYTFLERMNWNCKGKTVLDVVAKSGYYASYFGNMGAKSIAVEDDKGYRDLVILLNELLGWNVSVRTSQEYIEEELKCDLAIVSTWDNVFINKDLWRSIINNTLTGIIVEVMYEDIDEIRNDDVIRSKYEISQILEELVEDKILVTLVLWKREY